MVEEPEGTMAARRVDALPYAEHMARNTLVINCDIRETRVCLIENGVIAELHVERAAVRGSVGNIILGRVTRVLPGMQAAFIDVGMERAAFLHVEDLIRPDDFEAYLDKDGHREVGPAFKGDDAPIFGHGVGTEDEEDGNVEALSDPADNLDSDDADADADTDTDTDADSDSDSDIDSSPSDANLVREAAASDKGSELLVSAESSNTENEVPIGDEKSEDSDTPSPIPTQARSAAIQENRNRKRRRRGRNNGRQRDEPRPDVRKVGADRVAGRPGGREVGRDRRNRIIASRTSRAIPITEVVKEGDEVIVQVSKEPIGTKGARVTSHVALPGRHVVYLPTVDHIGISKRIGSAKERQRLRQVMESLKPETGGLIVRTVAEGLTKKNLKTDIGYLIALWKEVSRNKQGAKAPTTLYSELDLVLKTARDLFTDSVERIIIDDREQHARLVRFVEMFLPARVQDIELYTGDEPIFDAYGIEDEIGRALGRKVPLASGGYLVIDQAEALAAIDVNTGRYVGKGSKDLEETALKTNLEAVAEIAYQLRLRNIGGLVILDLIDMDQSSNREAVWRALEQALARDKAKTTINRISELGLIEMTRKRTRESLTRMLHEPCFYCDGTGQIQSRTTVAYEILRQIRRERHNLKGYSVVVNAHPAVVDLLQMEEKASVQEAERRYLRRIEFVPRREYHLEQFDLQGR
jgi:ribonuclease G